MATMPAPLLLLLLLAVIHTSSTPLHVPTAPPRPLPPRQFHTPTVEIAPGVQMPMLGLGTWQYNSSTAGAAAAVALGLGYELIDTALGYGNQQGIGAALRASRRPRTSYFLTSKIPGGLNATATTAALELCLQQLGLEYVDLMLVHFPADWGLRNTGTAQRVEQWRAMEAFVAAGKARAIGVSHYCKRHLQDLMPVTTRPIAVNQVQFHVGMGQAGPNATDDKAFCEAHGITYASFSPLCGPCGTTELINGPLVTSIGARHGKTGAQVSLRWQVQQGIPVIPKSQSPKHLKDNLDLFDWALTDAEMQALSAAVSPAVAGDGQGNSGDCAVP
uniref:NADP-dependent oxidoreductase domain-containing protein n=1 Tax=Eutreptiella gymnastica TaxID=73025 RepID=A0A7S1HRI9_9EUGL|mmetsp:Transcript_100040/g.172641  ORF Transcript_100040/g.172641 Transcript_100040/m.172641 type:complete len:331 (+) Transcript_100040:85-1077(+)